MFKSGWDKEVDFKEFLKEEMDADAWWELISQTYLTNYALCQEVANLKRSQS